MSRVKRCRYAYSSIPNRLASDVLGCKCRCSSGASGVRFEWFGRGMNITQFYHGVVTPDGAVLLAGAQDNGTLERDGADRVNFWNAEYGGDGSYSAIDRSDHDIRYYQSQFSNLVKTVDANGYATRFVYHAAGEVDPALSTYLRLVKAQDMV